MKSSILLVLSIALWTISAMSCLAADLPEFARGLEEFGYKRYNAASKFLETAVTKNPSDFRAHYYLGCCFERLKQFDLAKTEFEYAMRLNPFSDEGEKAKAALKELASLKEEIKQPPADDPKMYSETLKQINKEIGLSAGDQSTMAQEMFKRRMELMRRNMAPGVESDTGKLSAPGLNLPDSSSPGGQAFTFPGNQHGNNSALGNVPSSNGTTGNTTNNSSASNLSSPPPTIDSTASASGSQIQNDYQKKIDATMNRAITEVERRTAATKYELARQESASGLKTRLSSTPKKGEPKLRAVGTNLYVSYFGQNESAPPQDPPEPELKASTLSLDAKKNTNKGKGDKHVDATNQHPSIASVGTHADVANQHSTGSGGIHVDAANQAHLNPKETAIKYYYQADHLFRQGKVNEALPYYEKVYEMDPAGLVGKYSARVLNRYKKLGAKNIATVSMNSGLDTGSGNDTTKPDALEQQLDAKFAEIAKQLPKVVKNPKPTPALSELSGWSRRTRVEYYGQACARVDSAQQRLDDAKKLFDEIQRKLVGLGSSERKYGESAGATRARLDASKMTIDWVLKPYKDNLDDLTNQLADEKAIMQACQ